MTDNEKKIVQQQVDSKAMPSEPCAGCVELAEIQVLSDDATECSDCGCRSAPTIIISVNSSEIYYSVTCWECHKTTGRFHDNAADALREWDTMA